MWLSKLICLIGKHNYTSHMIRISDSNVEYKYSELILNYKNCKDCGKSILIPISFHGNPR